MAVTWCSRHGRTVTFITGISAVIITVTDVRQRNTMTIVAVHFSYPITYYTCKYIHHLLTYLLTFITDVRQRNTLGDFIFCLNLCFKL